MNDNQLIWDKVKKNVDAGSLQIGPQMWAEFVKEIDAYLAKSNVIKSYQLYTDAAARGNPGPSGIGVVIKDESGKTIKEFFEYIGEKTNNVAEYMALVKGLQLASELGIEQLQVFTDSELMTKQVNGEYKVKNKALIEQFMLVKEKMQLFSDVNVTHVKRNLNSGADRLANMAIDSMK